MDNGEKERAVANQLKDIVKHTSRRKATNGLSTKRDLIVKIAPKSMRSSVEGSTSDPESNRYRGANPLLTPASSEEDELIVLRDSSAVSLLSL
jgi:hypothetical protein